MKQLEQSELQRLSWEWYDSWLKKHKEHPELYSRPPVPQFPRPIDG